MLIVSHFGEKNAKKSLVKKKFSWKKSSEKKEILWILKKKMSYVQNLFTKATKKWKASFNVAEEITWASKCFS